jgi:hypothetical protein
MAQLGDERLLLGGRVPLRGLPLDPHRLAARRAGLDLELPETDCYGAPLQAALASGELPIELLVDAAVRGVRSARFTLSLFEDPFVEEHQRRSASTRPRSGSWFAGRPLSRSCCFVTKACSRSHPPLGESPSSGLTLTTAGSCKVVTDSSGIADAGDAAPFRWDKFRSISGIVQEARRRECTATTPTRP